MRVLGAGRGRGQSVPLSVQALHWQCWSRGDRAGAPSLAQHLHRPRLPVPSRTAGLAEGGRKQGVRWRCCAWALRRGSASVNGSRIPAPPSPCRYPLSRASRWSPGVARRGSEGRDADAAGTPAADQRPVPLAPGRPSATRAASTSGRGIASARTPTGATASATCSSAAAWGSRGRRTQGA